MNTHSIPERDPWVKRSPAGAEASVRYAETAEPEADTKGILETIAQFANFASLLRLSGALTVVAAMSAFLLHGWGEGNDINRYYMLLSQTVLLAVCGFGMSYLLQENKGARVFFGLGLLSVTANMATLGALVFSLVQWGGGLGHYPAFVTWKAPSLADLGLALGVGGMLLAPVALFGFMVLARRSSLKLAGVFLFVNLLLLLPVRESWMVGVIAMLGLLLPLWSASALYRSDATLRTQEGRFALATLFVPALIVLTRSLWLYDMDALLQALLAITGYAALRVVSEHTESGSTAGFWVGLGAFACAAFAASPLASLLAPAGALLAAYACFGFIFTLFGLDITLRSRTEQGLCAKVTAVILASSLLIPFLKVGDTASALLLTIAGLMVLAMGRAFLQRALLLLGAGMVLLGIGHQLYNFVAWVDFSNWITLAVCGFTAIITASVIERHGAVLKLKWQHFSRLAAGEEK